MPALPVQLVKYPEPACGVVSSIAFAAKPIETGLRLHYELRGDIARVKRAADRGGTRRDELWQTTCFELFVQAQDRRGYAEFNIAPNGDWAAYQFDGYRENMRQADVPPPLVETRMEDGCMTVQVEVSTHSLGMEAQGILLGPAVIIETLDSVRSYWALHHPADRPDFHLAQNFQISLD